MGFMRSSVLPAGLCLAAALAAGPCSATARAPTELVVATVNNAHMVQLQRLGPHFERANPDIQLKWVTLEESVLRQRVATAMAQRSAVFDVVSIGMYETQVWGRLGWLQALQTPPDYDVADLLPVMRSGLSVDGQLLAAPFYGESSMLMYRKDLTDRAGIRLPERPTWAQVREAAARIHDPANGVYGICLRGKPGWGENMALVFSMVSSYGGQWFDAAWRPQLDTQPWHEAVALYVDLLTRYGPPGSAANGYNELLALFQAGRCGLWVDATIGGAFVSDPQRSQVAQQVAFAQAPYGRTTRGANWLWAWSFAVPVASRHAAQAQRFVAWATSKQYVQLVASQQGWLAVPTGTRQSTYDHPAFAALAQDARHVAAEKRAIDSINPAHSRLPRGPNLGVQDATIAEFQTIGTAVGQQISAALAGRISVAQALAASQALAQREMRRAGHE